jgi:oxygen-dependent protoporphyrinogen oxidase
VRTSPAERSVAVIGAGIAGLTVAYRLSQTRDVEGRAPEVIVLEAGERVGGIVETLSRDGFTVERGSDSMITEKPWGVELCHEVGLGQEILTTNPTCRRSFVARGSTLHPVPDGFHLMAPSRLLPFARSSLLSWRGKLRVALEPFVATRKDDADESLASFVRRRLGVEALERIAQPMVGGIYTADPERLSLRATMPRFADMERTYGSVLRGLVAARRRADTGVAGASGPRYDLFVSLKQGMQQLPRTLASLLPSGALRRRHLVKGLERVGDRWKVAVGEGAIEVDAVCLAVPAYAAASLLATTIPAAARDLEAIDYASTATVTLAYPRESIAHPLDGFGFVVPAVEGRTTLACTFSSVKFPGRAPAGHALLRAFVGGALAPQNFELDDTAMVAAVEADLAELLGIRRPPLWSLVSRFPRSMPQYHVGHLQRMSRIEKALAAVPMLALAGNAYMGAGIPDTIRSANAAAQRLADALGLIPSTEQRA